MELRLPKGWRITSDAHNFILARLGEGRAAPRTEGFYNRLTQAVDAYRRGVRGGRPPKVWARARAALAELEALIDTQAPVFDAHAGSVALPGGWRLETGRNEVVLLPPAQLDAARSYHVDAAHALRRWLDRSLRDSDLTAWADLARRAEGLLAELRAVTEAVAG